MYAAYVCDEAVSSSYLRLVESLGLGITDLNWVNIAEFLQTANMFGGRTHFDCIEKIKSGDIHCFKKSSSGLCKHEITTKQIPDLTDKPLDRDLKSTFDGLSKALEKTKVSVDITGGLDTRTLIAGLYQADIDFECAIAGTKQHMDVVLSAEVADSIEKTLFVSEHEIGGFEKELDSILKSLDGLKTHIVTQHRIRNLQRDRCQRGVKLCLRGIGGEMYRDFRWTQDFPFYSSKNTRLERYDRLRIEVVRISDRFFSGNFQVLLDNARQRRLADFKQYQMSINTQSYDLLEWHEVLQNSHSKAMTVSSYQGLNVFCPLSEVFRMQHGFQCSRWRRAGSLFQKKFITECHLGLARATTSYGATASNEWRFLISGSLVLIFGNFKKLIRKVSQRYFGKSPFIVEAASHNECIPLLRQSAICRQAFRTLRDHGVLAADINSTDMTDRFIERCISLGWFLDRLNSPTEQVEETLVQVARRVDLQN